MHCHDISTSNLQNRFLNQKCILRTIFKLLAIVVSFSICGNAEFNPTERYIHTATLRSGNLKIYWKFNDSDITFEVHGRTEGWIGIGFSPNGAMTGADIIVGWVKNGITYVTDRHGTGNEFPPKDQEQSIDVIAGKECDGWTMFKFTRQLAACEIDIDRELSKNTQRLIYAYGKHDPSGDDITPEDYHGTTNRGVESMYLFEPSRDAIDIEEKTEYFDVLNEQFNVPAETTYYACKLHKVPTLSGKRHVIKYETIIQPGNEVHVHHIVIYKCGDTLKNPDELNKNARCHTTDTEHFLTCVSIIYSWAIGGGDFLMPKEAGFSLGGDGDPVYILAEIHYDNPSKRGDIIDSSGIRYIYTSNIRQHDAAVYETGNLVNPPLHFIPPKAKSFLNVAYCPQSCYETRMNSSNVNKITIFGVMLHSHLAGRKMKLRHFRNGEELPPIASDDSYNFNYQRIRGVDPMIDLIGATDYTRTECVYNTEDRTDIVEGGSSTHQEMCMAFVFYYPKIDFGLCTSVPSKTQTYPYFGIYNVTKIDRTIVRRFYDSVENYKVIAPSAPAVIGRTVGDVMSSYNWTEGSIDKFSSDILKMTHLIFCTGETQLKRLVQQVKYPVVKSPYIQETRQCIKRSSTLEQMKHTNTCSIASAITSNLFLIFAIQVFANNFSP